MKIQTRDRASAQGMVEYALALLLIAVVCLLILQIFGVSLQGLYCQVAGVFNASACSATAATTYCNSAFNNLNDWRVTSGASTNWTTSNGQMCANGYGTLTNTCSSSLPSSDYVAQIDGARLTSGNGYGIYFRATSSMNGVSGYAFQYDPGFNGVVIRKWVNGVEINPPLAVKSMPGNDWYSSAHTLSVKVSGNTYVGMLDGVPVLTATDSTYPSGGTALRVWDSTQVCMDNFSVSSAAP